MESLLQEALEGEGFSRVKIVRLENAEEGALKMIGCDGQGERYRLFPSPKDPNLAVMAWPGKEGTAEMNMQEGKIIFHVLAGGEQSKEEVLVGPAVDYSDPKAVRIDERGAALWRRVI